MFWTKNKGDKKAGTTIIGLVHSGKAAIGTDFDEAKKQGDEVGLVKSCPDFLIGFTGLCQATSIAENFVHKLDTREDFEETCREICQDWQTDEALCQIPGKLVALGRDCAYIITAGKADKVETGIVAIGPGEEYALAAIRAILAQPDVAESVEEIVKRAFKVAAGVCVLVNSNANIVSLN
jgi:ATP-dependent HslUV protease subunit HslV